MNHQMIEFGKNALKKLFKLGILNYLASTRYLTYIKKMTVDEYSILIEWQWGAGAKGNMYYVLKEISTNSRYSKYNLFLSVKKSSYNEVKNFLEVNGIKNVILIKYFSGRYFKTLASAKFLINDTTFNPQFIKRDEQVYINTWHGTPLKTLGRKVPNELHELGNVQKNFFVADYLLFPNHFTMNCITESFMLENICKAKVLLGGYPRNTAFFDKEKRQKIRSDFNLDNKQVFAYMPTWRGTTNRRENLAQVEKITNFLLEIDRNLNGNQMLYVNLHPFVNEAIDFEIFANILPFPKEYETYEFLNIADCLITDYSSVFFDYAITRKKIILFTYDKESYLSERGLYLDLEELPFPKVETMNELIKEMNGSKNYDDTEFLNEYCSYDHMNATKDLCERVILGIQNNIEELEIPNNNKENVLIYGGRLAKNGIVTSFENLLNNLDLDKRNYYLAFKPNSVDFVNTDILSRLPNAVHYFAPKGNMNMSVFQMLILVLCRFNLVSTKMLFKFFGDAYKYEIKRIYGDIKFSNVIQFSGYGYNEILLYSQFDTDKTIYVHNDMINEMKVRKNQHKDSLVYAYDTYDKVAVVTEDIIDPTKKLCKDASKIKIAHNVINYQRILDAAKEEVKLDVDTVITVSQERLENILNNQQLKKIVTIGRFSPEKGHLRLINSFNRLWEEHQDTYLIIIGGHGNKYQETINHIKKLQCSQNVIVIKSISNPYAVLKKCDYFILSSFYEGFGVVLAEADILGLPVVSTDIVGPRGFMQKHGGTLVENSEAGIYQGLKLLIDDKVNVMNVDFRKYNKQAINEFEQLL